MKKKMNVPYNEDATKRECAVCQRNTVKVYKAVVKEFRGVNRLFADVIDKLAEIE